MSKGAHHQPLGAPDVFALMQAIMRNDTSEVATRLELAPHLARKALAVGATRQTATNFFFKEISHYLVTGDTPLHAAAAGYRTGIVRMLLQKGADIAARNRRGAEPLHYAADGGPGSQGCNPQAQAETILLLIENGANPNTLDKSGVALLHRAVRQRSPSAVKTLLQNGADALLENKNGSTPLRLAVLTTGKSGSGSPEAKICQKEIIELLLAAGANPQDLNA